MIIEAEKELEVFINMKWYSAAAVECIFRLKSLDVEFSKIDFLPEEISKYKKSYFINSSKKRKTKRFFSNVENENLLSEKACGIKSLVECSWIGDYVKVIFFINGSSEHEKLSNHFKSQANLSNSKIIIGFQRKSKNIKASLIAMGYISQYLSMLLANKNIGVFVSHGLPQEFYDRDIYYITAL